MISEQRQMFVTAPPGVEVEDFPRRDACRGFYCESQFQQRNAV
jgi:hypothetical protein